MTDPRPAPARDVVSTASAPAAIGPYSQAVRAGGFLFISGQIGLDPVSGAMAGESVTAQTRQVLKNLQAILEAAGLTLASVVRTTVYLADLGDFAEMNAIYAEAFPSPAPARSTVEAARLPRDARIEIDAIATTA